VWCPKNPDFAAARSARSNAHCRYPGCVPPNFNINDTIPFYREARKRSRATGIPHEVDHIRALILGGKHVASNLQVITKEQNGTKSKAEQAEARRRHRSHSRP